MGWVEVHDEIEEAPFCEKRLRIVKILFCRKCDVNCPLNWLCHACYKNGVKHYFGYHMYDDYDKI